ncbi:hypothetical protein [Nitrosomonas communis]|nr:hypothetical protein [Nitrosomonas communis]
MSTSMPAPRLPRNGQLRVFEGLVCAQPFSSKLWRWADLYLLTTHCLMIK